MSEASAFGGVCVVVLAFTFSYWRRTNSYLALVISAFLVFLTIMSTSSTAYLSLIILLLGLAASCLGRILAGHVNYREVGIVLVAAVLVVTGLGMLSMDVASLAPMKELFDETITNKASSSSASERFYWNSKSIMAFYDTYGVGMGIGSSRASSSAIAMLSQLGAFGTALVVLLLVELARPMPPAPTGNAYALEVAAVCGSLRTAGFAMFIPSAIAGSSADPGILFFMALAGVVVGRSELQRIQTQRRGRAVVEPETPGGRPGWPAAGRSACASS
jgi:hypothetical protein